MVVVIPKIENGQRSNLYLTNDNKEFRDKDEANWHEFARLQLKERKLKFEIPEHTIYSFVDKETLEKYIAECYGHLEYIMLNDIASLSFPNNYVIIESELSHEEKIQHRISILSLEEFKKQLAVEILNL